MAALVDLGTGCFIPWYGIWRGMAGILHCRVGKAEVVGDGRGRDLWSDPASRPQDPCLSQFAEGHHALGPGEGKELRGQATGVMREGVLSHVSHLLSPLLHVPCYPSFLPLWLGLLGVAVSPASIPGKQWSPSAASCLQRGMRGSARPPPPASPSPQGCSQPAAVAAVQGVLQGSEHSVHVCTG